MDIDIKELMKAATEALNSEKFKGDVVGVKYVENEIGNVESGGIGVQKVYHGTNESIETDGQPVERVSASVENPEGDSEELFRFVHPSKDEVEGWKIHREVKNLVKRQGVQEICSYLLLMQRNEKILLPLSPQRAFEELIRLGMPQSEGYAYKTFAKHYKNG